MAGIRSIKDLNLKGKRVFMRVDFNVPIDDNGKVRDDTRIVKCIPSIGYALQEGAKLVLASHLGRPKGKPNPAMSLIPVGERLSELLNKDVTVTDSCIGDGVKHVIDNMKEGDVLLLENLRFHAGEQKNDPDFTHKLAQLCDVYVNDAFGTAHRAHASTAGLPELVEDKGAGFLMMKEVESLSRITEKTEHPFVAILGGAKVSDKIKVIENLLNKADVILIGGAMAYTFLKAQKISVGNSMVEDERMDVAQNLLQRAKEKKVELVLPEDHVVVRDIKDPSTMNQTESAEIPDGFLGVDIGSKSRKLFSDKIASAKSVFWNGPMGIFEEPRYAVGTMDVATFVADNKECISVVGGGDSVSAVNKSGLADRFTHISTGGGASLEFVEGIDLPGIKALRG